MNGNLNISEAVVASDGERYRPVAISSLRLDTEPVFDLYFRPGPVQPFVLYSERNHRITDDTLQRLRDNRIEQLFVRESELGDFRRYLAANMGAILADTTISPREKATLLYTSAQAVLEDVFDSPPTVESVGLGKEVVRHTVAFMTSDGFLLEHLLRTISTDYYLYSHSVNVVAYSVALAMRAGFSDAPTLRELANGALLHDIGMSRIDARLRNAPVSLTPDQWERVKRHPADGHEMLAETGNLGEVALDIVLHHHEKLNGQGYPHGLSNRELSPFVRIVSLANVFDALTTDRPHQPARKTFPALHVMQSEMRNEIDPDLFRMFVEMMGLRPATKA